MSGAAKSDGAEQGIGLWGAVAIGIGGMVGGGIFAVLGVVAEDAGSGAPLAFLLAGVVALLTARSYSKLSVKYPSRGGSVVFVDRVFGVRLATGALNTLLWFGYLVTLALYAVAFANYAETFVRSGQDPAAWLHHLLITAAILIPTGLNLLSAARVAEAETAIVALKLAILAIVGIAGTTTVDASKLAVSTWPGIPAIAAAGMLIFVAYEGFELIANSAEDVRQPNRNLKKAFFISVGVVIALYVAIAAVTVGSLSPDQIKSSSDFALAEAAKPSLGEAGFILVAVSAVLATLSAINATLYGTARLSYSIADEGELPPLLERKVWTEPVGLLITAAVSLLLANLLVVTEISSIASAVFLVVFGVVNAAAFKVATDSRTGRTLSALGIAGCAAAVIVLLIDTATNRPVGLVVFVGMVLASLVAEFTWLRRRRRIYLGSGSDRTGATEGPADG
ncbi:MAG: APC family permease [Acidimicrobiia bacterium]